MVQITACTDIGVKGFVLLIAMWKDRFNMPAEMIGKPIGCRFLNKTQGSLSGKGF